MKLLLSAGALAFGTWSFLGVYHSDVPAAPWDPARQSSTPLDGGWYWIEQDGCFADDYVIEVHGSLVEGRIDNERAALPYSYEQHGKWVRMKLATSDDLEPTIVWYRDYGNRLDPTWLERDGKRVRMGESAIGFARCDAPTWAGKIKSLWRPAYDPNDYNSPSRHGRKQSPT